MEIYGGLASCCSSGARNETHVERVNMLGPHKNRVLDAGQLFEPIARRQARYARLAGVS